MHILLWVLIIVLVLGALGGSPSLGYAPAGWGWGPSGGLGLLLLVVLFLLLLGRL